VVRVGGNRGGGAPKGHLPYNIYGEGGRPTKLTEEVVRKAEKYVGECISGLDDILVKKVYSNVGMVTQELFAPRLPNPARMAMRCGIHKATMYRWLIKQNADGEKIEFKDKTETKKYNALLERFCDCFAYVENCQEVVLVEEGGAGRLNAQVANRILAAKHSYQERTENKIDGNLTVEVVQYGEG